MKDSEIDLMFPFKPEFSYSLRSQVNIGIIQGTPPIPNTQGFPAYLEDVTLSMNPLFWGVTNLQSFLSVINPLCAVLQ